MLKILVVYYSRTGFTSTISRQIAGICNAEFESIKLVEKRNSALGYLQSACEATLHMETPLRRIMHTPDNYDIIVIGTPVWCHNIASPVRTYIHDHRHQFTQVAFFCTSGGSGQKKVLRDLEKLAGKTPIATLSLTDNEIKAGMHHDQITEFVARLKSAENTANQ